MDSLPPSLHARAFAGKLVPEVLKNSCKTADEMVATSPYNTLKRSRGGIQRRKPALPADSGTATPVVARFVLQFF
jgi:hypothetical protein